MYDFTVDFTEISSSFNLDFQSSEDLNTNFGEMTYVREADHNLLYNRNLANQHPISAIASLNSELSARPSTAISNAEIEAL